MPERTTNRKSNLSFLADHARRRVSHNATRASSESDSDLKVIRDLVNKLHFITSSLQTALDIHIRDRGGN